MLESLDEAIGWVHSKLDDLTNTPYTMEHAFTLLRRQRQIGWLAFDLYRRKNRVRAARVERVIREVVARSTAPDDYRTNLAELGAWQRMPDSKREPAVKRWEEWAADLRSAALDGEQPWVPKTWDEMHEERLADYREDGLLDAPTGKPRRAKRPATSGRGSKRWRPPIVLPRRPRRSGAYGTQETPGRSVTPPVTGGSPPVVMQMLGHSTIALTMNTYSHVIPQLERDAADHMEVVLRRPLDSVG